MDEAYNYFKQMNRKPEQDECSLYTELLCKKLRGLQEKTREIAMLEIDKLIFHLKQNEMLIQSSSHSEIQIPSASFQQSQPFNYQHFHELRPIQQPHRSATYNHRHSSSHSPQASPDI